MEQEDVREHEEQPNDPPEVEEPEGGEGEEPEVEGDDQPEEQEPEQPRESEARRRAREKGWVPKDEYTGRPENWVDEHEYLKSPPALRQERDGWQRKAESLEKQLGMVAGKVDEIEQRGYDRAMRELTAQQERAVEEGDVDRWRDLEKQKGELKPPQKPEPGPQGEPGPELKEWLNENPWFGRDEKLTEEAKALEAELTERHPYMPDKARLKRISDEVMRRNPDLFGIDPQPSKPRYARPQKVSGTETRGGNSAGSNGKGWSDIPQEDRDTAKSIIGEGRMYKTQADYAKSYWRHYG